MSSISNLSARNEFYNDKERRAYESPQADRVLGYGIVPSNQSILPIGLSFHNRLPISVPLCPTLWVSRLFLGGMSVQWSPNSA